MPAHFEIHVSDMGRARDFYGKVFGWSFEPMPGMGPDVEYELIAGPDIGEGHSLTGALISRMGDAPASGGPIRGCTLTFEVADCDATYAAALAHGGSEALPPDDHPGIGRFAYAEDGQGNVVGMITSEQDT